MTRSMRPIGMLCASILVAVLTLAVGTASSSAQTASNAYFYEIEKYCGSGTIAQTKRLFLAADGAETAGDKEKETSASIQLIELGSACVANLTHASDEARIWVQGTILTGLVYRMASADDSDANHLFGQMGYQLVVACSSPLITSPVAPGATTREQVISEFDRLARIASAVNIATSPYAPYLIDLRSCASRIGYQRQF